MTRELFKETDRFSFAVRMPDLDLKQNYDTSSQLDKIEQEFQELKEAIKDDNFEEAWKEYSDLLQAALGLFQHLPIRGNDPQKFVTDEFEKHYEKLRHRASSKEEENLLRKRNNPIVGCFIIKRV